MRILVIGSGGREHALVWKISQSPRVKKIFCAPGNAGIASLAECVAVKADDIAGLFALAKKEAIDLTVVGPEAPLVAGIVDVFRNEGLKIFGPAQKAARLEASKAFAKRLMLEQNVPTAAHATCLSVHEAHETIAHVPSFPVVIKADGLAAGKGVIICDNEEAALEAVSAMQVKKVFGDAGDAVVIEEFLEGEEASLLFLTNGEEAIPLASSQDHKRIFDNDQGPNTGGMGAYSPAPVVTDVLLREVMERVVAPVLRGMKAQGALYQGILYVGIMVTKSGLKVLEFNVRFGDPETQAVLARLDSDLVEAMLWAAGAGPAPRLKWSPRVSVCVVITSGGYPGPYDKGKEIKGLDDAARIKDVVIFHAGTQMSQVIGSATKTSADWHKSPVLTDGGRVLGVTGLGVTLKEAIDAAYAAAGKISFEGMHVRRDIGWRALKKSE
jgi:phosphoribosylamine--glycine ligase